MHVNDIVATVGELFLRVKELNAEVEAFKAENAELREKIVLFTTPPTMPVNSLTLVPTEPDKKEKL